ncbi:hypothetical protein PR048_004805 [Dryococelus australis]|uniref:SPIN-DOC-like zinc-finger domain-containing protein n=1 Tax=Dryococelus australis TaxID=614101 RepID=A0ABQ9I7J3_9NEOP|nr:hypothetical protein PR048_004805 [Dryococelus australis]
MPCPAEAALTNTSSAGSGESHHEWRSATNLINLHYTSSKRTLASIRPPLHSLNIDLTDYASSPPTGHSTPLPLPSVNVDCTVSFDYFVKMSGKSVKCKIDSENRIYKESWESDYLIANNNGKLQCLVCMQVVSVPKEYNVKRHYSTMHESKFANYKREATSVLVGDFKKKMKQQTNMSYVQTHSLYASDAVSLEIAKAKKPFTYGSLVKTCAIEVAKVFVDAKLAGKLESVALSPKTIQRRIIDMGEQVEKLMLRAFAVCSLHGTTKGKDTYDAVKKSVDRIEGLSKCSVIITDGTPAMTGNNM